MFQVTSLVTGSLLCDCQINLVCYKLHLPLSLCIPSAFHVSLLKPIVLNRFSRKPVSPSDLAGPEDTFEIKEILEIKCFK